MNVLIESAQPHIWFDRRPMLTHQRSNMWSLHPDYPFMRHTFIILNTISLIPFEKALKSIKTFYTLNKSSTFHRPFFNSSFIYFYSLQYRRALFYNWRKKRVNELILIMKLEPTNGIIESFRRSNYSRVITYLTVAP